MSHDSASAALRRAAAPPQDDLPQPDTQDYYWYHYIYIYVIIIYIYIYIYVTNILQL